MTTVDYRTTYLSIRFRSKNIFTFTDVGLLTQTSDPGSSSGQCTE